MGTVDTLKVAQTEKLQTDGIVRVGRKLYVRCQGCKKIVQINKFIVGSLHVCGD